MEEVPQIQFIDKLVDALVFMQRHMSEAAVTTGVTTHRKRKGSDILRFVQRVGLAIFSIGFQRCRGHREEEQCDGHEHETLYANNASDDEKEDEMEVDVGDDMTEETVVPTHSAEESGPRS